MPTRSGPAEEGFFCPPVSSGQSEPTAPGRLTPGGNVRRDPALAFVVSQMTVEDRAKIAATPPARVRLARPRDRGSDHGVAARAWRRRWWRFRSGTTATLPSLAVLSIQRAPQQLRRPMASYQRDHRARRSVAAGQVLSERRRVHQEPRAGAAALGVPALRRSVSGRRPLARRAAGTASALPQRRHGRQPGSPTLTAPVRVRARSGWTPLDASESRTRTSRPASGGTFSLDVHPKDRVMRRELVELLDRSGRGDVDVRLRTR